jgi:hypothetical protein
MKTPAETVIEICGGHRAVADLCGVDVTRVYRWTYPATKGGTGGLVPARHQVKLLSEARARNIALEPEHFFAPAETLPAGVPAKPPDGDGRSHRAGVATV